MRTLVITLLLGCLMVAQAADLPDAPSAVANRKPTATVTFEYSPAAKRSWQQRHKRAIIVTGVALGVAAGVGISIATRRGTCPSIINGYPYDGTPPCPPANYDPTPGNRKR